MPANYVLLERVEVGATAVSSITFNSIPQTGYTDLKIVCSVRSTDSVNSSDNIVLNFNGSTANFSGRALYGTGSAAASLTRAATSTVTWIDVATDTANTFASVEFYIPNYTSANYKSVSSESVQEGNITAVIAAMGAILRSNTAAITSIALTSGNAYSFAQYSTFSLYGLAAVGTTPTRAPKASGGSIIQTDGTYWYHAFLASGTFTPAVGLTCDVLVVAGGGGGGWRQNAGGGGGAGGLRGITSQSLSVTSYNVTVGAAGAASTASQVVGGKGGNSSFDSTTATGGGGGGSGFGGTGGNAVTGGSGGGGWAIDPSTPTNGAAGNQGGFSPVEGFAGGNGVVVSSYGSGGGGGGSAGVGAVGAAAAGAGGVGSSAYSSWGLATTTGQNVSGTVYYAGGGGGGRDDRGGTTGGAGGNGGGGKGGGSAGGNAVSGTANTGGAGGGGYNNGSTQATGGSGIVIVRYLA